MPSTLFRNHRMRSLGVAALAVLAAHLGARRLPPRLDFIASMVVALLALAAVVLLVIAANRRRADVLTQTQEEMVLLFAFGLFWFCILLVLRWYAGGVGLVAAAPAVPGGATGHITSRTPLGMPCTGPNVRLCIVEEWSF
ncbi:hypothetical protein AURDEDRAFT_157026 [Auricularia subglabra TFB-10046 SS5]|nr:hypothetical protein AURDEDRAFT_157026 [Auricularia subglabra TFB-10046 SS5]